MKKVSLPRRTKTKKDTRPTRITNETVAEHRERILAGGRRFKYPVQYARHRLVINAIIVAVVALVLFLIICWQQLYIVQNTNSFFYRLTNFVPVPVASIDGKSVRYSDYLLFYNGSAHYLQKSEQVDFSTKDGKLQQQHIKRQSLNDAEADAYAQKLAKANNISVNNNEVDAVINESRRSYGNISERAYDASALSILGWTPSEYRHMVHDKLIRQKVAYSIDGKASRMKDLVQKQLLDKKSPDFSSIVSDLNKQYNANLQVGTSGMVPLNNSDGGLSQAAAKLKVGETSGVVKSTTGDGYYFVRLLSRVDAQLNYTYIRVPLTVFDEKVASLRTNHKITEYINVPAEKESDQ